MYLNGGKKDKLNKVDIVGLFIQKGNLTKEEFIKEILTGLTTPPGYFPQNVLMNIKGYDSMDEVMENPSAKSMLLEEIIDEIETKRLSGVAFQLRT